MAISGAVNSSSTPRGMTILIWIGAFFLVLGSLAFALFLGLYSFQVKPTVRQQTERQQKSIAPMLEEMAQLSQVPEFAPLLAKNTTSVRGTASSDAADFFAALKKDDRALIPKATQESLLRLQDKWLEGYAKIDRWKMDISWFSDLGQYSTWLFDQTHSIPDTQEFLCAAKLRLMQGARGQNPGPALRDTRNFANLLLSSGQYDLVHLGLTVLDLERRAHRFYSDRGWMLGEWKPVEKSSIRMAQRFLSALPSLLHFWGDPKTLMDFFYEGADALPGYCAVVTKALPKEMIYTDWLKDGWPFEHSFADAFSALNKIETRTQTLCEWTGYTAVKNKLRDRVSRPGPVGLNFMPYARVLFLTWSSASSPLTLGAYTHDWNVKPDSVLKGP